MAISRTARSKALVRSIKMANTHSCRIMHSCKKLSTRWVARSVPLPGMAPCCSPGMFAYTASFTNGARTILSALLR